MSSKRNPTVRSAFFSARGAPPPLAAASRIRARQQPQALPIPRSAINQVQPGTSFGQTARLAIAFALLLPAVAGAEYRRIELKILGMDCATCAHGVRNGVQRVAAVESVELSLERAEADIRLADGNRVPLDQFRRIVRANGFEPKEARVTVRGTVREIAGKLVLEVSGPGTSLVISPDKSAPEPYKQLKTAWESKSTATFEVVGTVDQAVGGVETIAIATIGSRQ
jgi:copper chaperone CopZ